jgi:hypothetical protein
MTGAKWTGVVAQVVECLLYTGKPLSSNPSPTKKKKKKRRRRKNLFGSQFTVLESQGHGTYIGSTLTRASLAASQHSRETERERVMYRRDQGHGWPHFITTHSYKN